MATLAQYVYLSPHRLGLVLLVRLVYYYNGRFGVMLCPIRMVYHRGPTVHRQDSRGVRGAHTAGGSPEPAMVMVGEGPPQPAIGEGASAPEWLT